MMQIVRFRGLVDQFSRCYGSFNSANAQKWFQSLECECEFSAQPRSQHQQDSCTKMIYMILVYIDDSSASFINLLKTYEFLNILGAKLCYYICQVVSGKHWFWQFLSHVFPFSVGAAEKTQATLLRSPNFSPRMGARMTLAVPLPDGSGAYLPCLPILALPRARVGIPWPRISFELRRTMMTGRISCGPDMTSHSSWVIHWRPCSGANILIISWLSSLLSMPFAIAMTSMHVLLTSRLRQAWWSCLMHAWFCTPWNLLWVCASMD